MLVWIIFFDVGILLGTLFTTNDHNDFMRISTCEKRLFKCFKSGYLYFTWLTRGVGFLEKSFFKVPFRIFSVFGHVLLAACAVLLLAVYKTLTRRRLRLVEQVRYILGVGGGSSGPGKFVRVRLDGRCDFGVSTSGMQVRVQTGEDVRADVGGRSYRFVHFQGVQVGYFRLF